MLVLLPGLDGTGELFEPFLRALDGLETRVIRYPDRAMAYAGHEDFARCQLPVDRDYVLLAESFSGPVAIAIAASPPARLRGLVLCATFASNPLPSFGSFGKLIGGMPGLRVPPALTVPWLYAGRATPELRRAHARALSHVSPRTLNARVAAVLSADCRSALRRIGSPILYLRALRDRLVSPRSWQEIHAIAPGAELAEFDAPHFLLQTEGEVCARRVRVFCERVLR